MKRGVLTLLVFAAACGGDPGITGPTLATTLPTPPPPGVSAAVAEMFGHLDSTIRQAIATNEANLPSNPRLADLFAAKLAMLRQPGFAAGISRDALYVESSAVSRNGQSVPIVAIFAQAGMRDDAAASVRELEQVFGILEAYLEIDYPYGHVWLWYGFVIGNSGGGGRLNIEERTSYETRTPSTRLPYDAILAHEHAHSYIGTEALTQFLEMHVYNVARTGSQDLSAWSHTRGYQPFDPANIDAAALLDIYQRIGPATMAAGYRAVFPFRPPYGSPLSEEVKQAFAAVVPEALRAEVLEKLSAIRF